MSISVCSISGQPLIQASVSTKTGHLFQKSTITKHLSSFSFCPITNQPLSLEDIIDIKSSNLPVSTSLTSIPTMISQLNSDYDTLVLESYELKKNLHETRQELSHALYQYDAATRVIAKLLKERDDARKDIATLNLKLQKGQGKSEE